MAIRQLMSDVRPDEEAALRALVPPVEPIQQPQDSAVLGYWPMHAVWALIQAIKHLAAAGCSAPGAARVTRLALQPRAGRVSAVSGAASEVVE